MRLAILTMSILMVGCAQMYAAVPYLPAAKVGYCAAADQDTRDAIRARYNLPKVVRCSGDTDENQLEAQASD